MKLSPTEEKALYDEATDLVETEKTALPVSILGMQARKKAKKRSADVEYR